MPADHLNPNISNVAARYVAKAMTRVHPAQRMELLVEMEKHIRAARAVIQPKEAA